VKDLATLDSVLVETSNPLLSLLPAGATPRSRRAVLARSSGLDLVLAKLDASFDHLVFDVPPVLTSSESLPIVYLAQAHLLVVRHGSTTIPQVRDVADRLRAVPSLGVVMNQYRPHMPARLQRLFAV
jgi:Mrp family chromosome partitioning ATPase